LASNSIIELLVNFLERRPQPLSGKIKLDPFKIVTVKVARVGKQ